MWDKVELEAPLAESYVNQQASSKDGKLVGSVDPRFYDFTLIQIISTVNGELEVHEIKAQSWDTISTGMSGVAVGFFPNGNGFNQWPHVRIKSSPAKILQGHNVFGSENPKQGIAQMLANFAQVYPKIYDHLDLDNIHVKYVDCTYSSKIRPFYRTHIYRTFGALARSNQKVSRHDDYLKIGSDTQRTCLKIYYKLQELLADLKSAKRANENHRAEILSDQRLQDWALDLMRFEATVGPRKFEEMGIPTRLPEFLKFIDWFEETHGEKLCRYLWSVVFKPTFAQLEGHTMKSINDDDVRAMVDKTHITVSANGRVSKRRSNATFKCYLMIKTLGYDVLSKQKNSSFFDNVNNLVECGLSRAFLKTLGPDSPDNVIPLIQVINIDFKNQRPNWWVEPKAGFSNHALLPKSLAPFSQKLRLVG